MHHVHIIFEYFLTLIVPYLIEFLHGIFCKIRELSSSYISAVSFPSLLECLSESNIHQVSIRTGILVVTILIELKFFWAPCYTCFCTGTK